MEQSEFPKDSLTLEHTMSSTDNDREIMHNEMLPMLMKLFSTLNLSWKKTLMTQFQTAQIAFYDYGSSWFFDFSYEHDVTPISVTQPVPIFVDICTKLIVTGEDVLQLVGDPTAYWLRECQCCNPGFTVKSASNSYISCYLHIKSGLVFELEVVNWNGQKINYHALYADLCHGQRIYRINEPWIAEELSKSS